MKKATLVALIGIVALVPATGEAAKAKPKKSCPSEAICVWTKASFEGKRVVVKSEDVSNRIAKEINNKTSSIKNRFDQTILIYDKRNAKGEFRCLGAMEQVENLAGSYNYDNRTTSSDVPDDPGPCL